MNEQSTYIFFSLFPFIFPSFFLFFSRRPVPFSFLFLLLVCSCFFFLFLSIPAFLFVLFVDVVLWCLRLPFTVTRLVLSPWRTRLAQTPNRDKCYIVTYADSFGGRVEGQNIRISENLIIIITLNIRTISLIFIVLLTAFRSTSHSALFRCFMSNSSVHTESRIQPLIQICSSSMNHDWVQVLSYSKLSLLVFLVVASSNQPHHSLNHISFSCTYVKWSGSCWFNSNDE